MKKTIIVLGTWSSGSGAVSDYLSSREDCINPFGTNEFKLISDPGGLHNMYKNFYHSSDLLLPSKAIEDFKIYTKNLEKYFVYSDYGVKKKLYDKDFLSHTNKFIKDITFLSYRGWPHFKDITSTTLSKKIKRKIQQKLFDRKIYEIYNFPIIVPVEKHKFIEIAQKFIYKIMKIKINNSSKKNIVLNNAADICDPIGSTQYFKNKKIICVTRDPRDIFCGMKLRQANSTPWYDVKIFIKWYKHFFGNENFLKNLKKNNILKIEFENFVLDFNNESKKISKFLEINPKNIQDKNLFDLEKTKKNLFKSKILLTKNEINQIEKNLENYLQW